MARAYVENGMQSWPQPVKLFYIGPQFRYERPQKGRYRQFHQIGAELLGEASPAADAELLLMLDRFLQALGFGELTVLLNTVGDQESRDAYRQRAGRLPRAPPRRVFRRTASDGSRPTRCASSTARTRGTGRSSSARRRSPIT